MYIIIYSYYNKRGDYMTSRLDAKTLEGIKSKLKKAYNERDFKDIERISNNLIKEDLKSDLKRY